MKSSNKRKAKVSEKKVSDKVSDLELCERDYYNKHEWKIVGADNGFIIYRCGQCRKCKREKIVLVEESE